MQFYNQHSDRIIFNKKNHLLSDGKYISKTIKACSIKNEESFHQILSSDFPIIEGLLTDFRPNSFEEYLKLVDESRTNMEFYKLTHFFKEGDNFINLLHLLQPHEAEVFYESSMTLVINGHEWDKYEDGIMPNYAVRFYAPGYVFRESRFGEIFNIVPSESRIDFPLLHNENVRCSYTYISKECIDKAILYKRFKDPATIGTKDSYNSYTGKVETVELDFKNIDEAVLQEFISHGVIRPLDKPLDETEIAQQIAHARAESVKSQKEYLEWLKNQH